MDKQIVSATDKPRRTKHPRKWGVYVMGVYMRFPLTKRPTKLRMSAGVTSGFTEQDACEAWRDEFFRREAMHGGHPVIHVVGPKYHRMHLVVVN
jgi:hypothetical protein